MATKRTLTIAGLKGTFRVGFPELFNRTRTFEASGTGSISVERSTSGDEYFVKASADNFRVTVELEGPDKLEDLKHWDHCTAYGWWQVDGFPKTEFTSGEGLKSAGSGGKAPKPKAGGKG